MNYRRKQQKAKVAVNAKLKYVTDQDIKADFCISGNKVFKGKNTISIFYTNVLL